MNPQILIDAIVRQMTVLIARIATAEGVRSPLGHAANEVLVGLVAELGNQGVSNKVIADMFGMALRSYRQKVQRLGATARRRSCRHRERGQFETWRAVVMARAITTPADRASHQVRRATARAHFCRGSERVGLRRSHLGIVSGAAGRAVTR